MLPSKREMFDPTIIPNLSNSSFDDEMRTVGITPDQNSPNVINPQGTVIDISYIDENGKKRVFQNKMARFDEVKTCHNGRR